VAAGILSHCRMQDSPFVSVTSTREYLAVGSLAARGRSMS